MRKIDFLNGLELLDRYTGVDHRAEFFPPFIT